MRKIFALCVFGLLGVAHAAHAEVIWRGDFETGDISQWSKAQQVAPDRLQVVNSPVRQGQHALRVEVRQGDDPINASGNRAELVWLQPEKEGNDRYYGWSTMWPSDYPSVKTWQLFTQWHHTGNTGSPPLEMYVNGETMYLRVEGQNVIWSHPLERGKWHDFVLHVKWSSDPGVGFVEIWYDGQLSLGKTTAATMYPGQDNLLKQGLYRNDTISQVGVIYHDGFTAGTTLADVMPQAGGGGGSPTPTPGATTPPAGGTPAPGGTTDGTAQPGVGTGAGTGVADGSGVGGNGAVDGTGTAASGDAAPAGSGGCSLAGAHARRDLGGAGGFMLGLLGLALALRGALGRRRVK